ncbi:NAD(P)-binding domain-containing protein [Streptomyces sp. NPDC001984]
MTATISRVGFIGLGDQGGPMAEAIGEHGFELHVWARRSSSLAAVERVPHTVHGTVQRVFAGESLWGPFCVGRKTLGLRRRRRGRLPLLTFRDLPYAHGYSWSSPYDDTGLPWNSPNRAEPRPARARCCSHFATTDGS